MLRLVLSKGVQTLKPPSDQGPEDSPQVQAGPMWKLLAAGGCIWIPLRGRSIRGELSGDPHPRFVLWMDWSYIRHRERFSVGFVASESESVCCDPSQAAC